MPDKKSSEKDQDKESGKKSLLPIVIIGVVMLGGGYFVGGMMSGGSEPVPVAEASDEVEAVEEKAELGHLEALDAVNVNLQNGHFLRIAVTLEIHSDDESSGDSHGADDAEAFATAPAADLVLTTFSGRDMEELSLVDGREALRQELLEKVIEKYGEKVTSLYFTEFVMQ